MMKMASVRPKVWFLFWIAEARKVRRCCELVKAILAVVDKWNEKDYCGYWTRKLCVLEVAMRPSWIAYFLIMEIEVK